MATPSTLSCWCIGRRVRALPASGTCVANYVAVLVDDGLSLSTIQRRMSAIGYVHADKGFARPNREAIAQAALAGAARTVGSAQRRVEPITLAMLRAMSARRFVLSDPVMRRDRAMLLLG